MYIYKVCISKLLVCWASLVARFLKVSTYSRCSKKNESIIGVRRNEHVPAARKEELVLDVWSAWPLWAFRRKSIFQRTCSRYQC